MNQLSWLLYAADVVDKVNVTAAIVFVPTVLATIFAAVVSSAHVVDYDEENGSRWAGIAKRCGLTALCIALVTAPIPSKDTIYAIAVSEMGEQALATPLAGKATKALEAWLDKQIAGDEKEDK